MTAPTGGSAAIAVVVPARNQGTELSRLLASLRAQAPPEISLELVVVDDASEEDLAPICARFDARRLRLDRPSGPARARNEGARCTSSPLLLFLDADVLCPPGLFAAIDSALVAEPDALAVSFRSTGFDPSRRLVANFAAALEHYWLGFYLAGGRALAALPGVTTRNVVVRRPAFERIGGFDPVFRTNAIEDYDFGKRLSESGRTLICGRPELPHRFPAKLSRLLRNYAVRASLFGRYYLGRRPRLDPVQVAAGEALLRLLGTVGLLTLAFAPSTSAAPWLAAAGGGLLAAYLFAIRGFLAHAARLGSRRFAALCALIHVATSPVIVAGAGWGFLAGSAERLRRGPQRGGWLRGAGVEP